MGKSMRIVSDSLPDESPNSLHSSGTLNRPEVACPSPKEIPAVLSDETEDPELVEPPSDSPPPVPDDDEKVAASEKEKNLVDEQEHTFWNERRAVNRKTEKRRRNVIQRGLNHGDSKVE